METVLLDTDVCLDSLAGREPWNADANRIFHASVEGSAHLFICSLTFSNLFYLLHRTHGAEKTVQKLSSMRKLVAVSPVNQDIVDTALSSGWSDFEDALHYYSALAVDCDILVTRNLSDYKKAENIIILSPSAFLADHLNGE